MGKGGEKPGVTNGIALHPVENALSEKRKAPFTNPLKKEYPTCNHVRYSRREILDQNLQYYYGCLSIISVV